MATTELSLPLLLLIFGGLFSRSRCRELQPYVQWTMDNFSTSELYPENQAGENWIGKLPNLNGTNPLCLFSNGVEGLAIHIDSFEMSLARNLSGSECLIRPPHCDRGLTIMFWIKLQKLGELSENSIMRISKSGCNVLDIAFTNTTFSIRLAQSSFIVDNDQFLKDKWINIAVTWNTKDGKIKVYMNGTISIGTTEHGVNCNDTAPESHRELFLGSRGEQKFYLDDLRIYYDLLDATEVKGVYSYEPSLSAKNYTKIIVLATVIPSVSVIVILSLICWAVRKTRARRSFSSYVRQSSRDILEENDRGTFSDTHDEHTDLDSDGELERLYRRISKEFKM